MTPKWFRWWRENVREERWYRGRASAPEARAALRDMRAMG